MCIDEIIKEGGDRTTGYIPVTYSDIAKRINISRQTVKKIWQKFCESNEISKNSCGGSRNSKLNAEDLELIEGVACTDFLHYVINFVQRNGTLSNL